MSSTAISIYRIQLLGKACLSYFAEGFGRFKRGFEKHTKNFEKHTKKFVKLY